MMETRLPQSSPINPGRPHGDVGVSRLSSRDGLLAGPEGFTADTDQHYKAAPNNNYLGVIRHDGIAQHDRNGRRMAPKPRVRMAA
jgi:hypothetical protein